MSVLDKPEQIAQYTFRSNLMTLELEIDGIKIIRGQSAYVRMKKIHNVKGSRRKVYNLLRDKYIKLYPDAPKPKEIN